MYAYRFPNVLAQPPACYIDTGSYIQLNGQKERKSTYKSEQYFYKMSGLIKAKEKSMRGTVKDRFSKTGLITDGETHVQTDQDRQTDIQCCFYKYILFHQSTLNSQTDRQDRQTDRQTE